MDWFSAATPLIIAHRGASAYEAENTIPAFLLAAEQGADGFELDVQLTSDHHPVIIHDSRVDRTTSGTGAVADLSLAELQRLVTGEDQRIPTLDELFETLGAEFLYNIEIKETSWLGQGAAGIVAATVRAHDMEGRVLLSSFNPFTVRRARNAFPHTTPVALIRAPGPLKYLYWLGDGEADHPHHSLVDSKYMSWAANRGYRVHVWTVDKPEEARRLAALGVHGIITNQPDTIRNSL